MPGLEGIIRPFAEKSVSPVPVHQQGANAVAPIRLAIGLVGGTKTFSYSASSSLSSYMASVHTEKESRVFDMSTGKLRE